MGDYQEDQARRNVVVIMNDSLRRDHVGAYGEPIPWALKEREGIMSETPALDRLAASGTLFDNFYVSSYPTVPCRTDLFTGRYGFPTRGWQPLARNDILLSEILTTAGWATELIFDTPMLIQDSYNFHRGFSGWDFVRGQHADPFDTSPLKPSLPAQAHKLRSPAATKLYLRNSRERRYERDWMCARTASRAMDWLEDNREQDGFLLWVDMWDPHEPFDAPSYDLARFIDPAYTGDRVIYPQYGRADYLSADELNFVRASYAALVRVVDRWVGKLIDKIDTLGLRENTLVIFLTDHGHLFGDHGLEGKPTGRLGSLYEPTVKIPLIVRHPDGVGAGTRPTALAQHVDILPTILDFLGVEAPATVRGQSLVPVLSDPDAQVREAAFSGRHSPGISDDAAEDVGRFDGHAGIAGQLQPLTVSTSEWALIQPPHGRGAQLFNLASDPMQLEDLAQRYPTKVTEMRDALLQMLLDEGAPDPWRDTYSGNGSTAQLMPESVNLDAKFYCLRDERGRLFAFTSPSEAKNMGGAADASELETLSWDQLLGVEPTPLIMISQQYFFPHDLMDV